MTIVVAVKKGKDMIVAADSLRTFGSRKYGAGNVREEKIRRIGTTLIASTGWSLYNNILTDYLARKTSVRLNTQQDVFSFFVEFWQALHKKYSFVNDQCDQKDSPFGDLDASFLIVTKECIFLISGDMSVTEFNKFHAIGSGCDFAIGAMHVLYDQSLDAKAIAGKAVETAIEHNIYCGGEITFLKP